MDMHSVWSCIMSCRSFKSIFSMCLVWIKFMFCDFLIKLQANIALHFLTIDSEYIAICLVYLSDIHISLNRSFFCLLIYNNNPSSATHFSETIKLDITGESFAQQTIYMKCWILISLKKNVNISSAAVVIGTVRDNIDYFVFIPYTTFQVTPLRWWFLRESFAQCITLHGLKYHIYSKYWSASTPFDTWPKVWPSPFHYIFVCLKTAVCMANCADSTNCDVWSWFTLFVQACLSQYLV